MKGTVYKQIKKTKTVSLLCTGTDDHVIVGTVDIISVFNIETNARDLWENPCINKYNKIEKEMKSVASYGSILLGTGKRGVVARDSEAGCLQQVGQTFL